MKNKILTVFALLLTGTAALFTACSSNPPATPAAVATNTPVITSTPTNSPTNTPTGTPTTSPTNTPTSTPSSTPSNTPTATITNTPGPVLFESFDASPWNPGMASNSYMCGNVTGYGGTTSAFTQSSTNHSGGFSLQATLNTTVAYGYGYLGFYSSFSSIGWGAATDVRLNGTSAPVSLSLWAYSAQATYFFLGIWDGIHPNSYTTSLPAAVSVPATTWTNIVVPLSGSLWDANIATIDWSHVTYVLVAPNDLTGAASNSFTFNVDDVYFTP